jgi:23S rRNA (pseudouridine1915-N3)-methyltransferase
MRITIAAIGKMRAGPEAALTGDFIKRAQNLGRNLGFSGPELIEMEAPRGLTGAKRQAREGELLLSAAPSAATIICLDERGKNMPREKLASLLSQWRDDGASDAAFLIGGADGHDAAVLAKASLSLSFGAATWPHMLVRVMLAEQLYRAMTILSGHPYHRS